MMRRLRLRISKNVRLHSGYCCYAAFVPWQSTFLRVPPLKSAGRDQLARKDSFISRVTRRGLKSSTSVGSPQPANLARFPKCKANPLFILILAVTPLVGLS